MRRNIKNPLVRKAFFVLAGALALFHILIITVWLLDTIYIVAVDLMVGMVLIFCLHPATQWSPKDRMTIFDAALAFAAIAVGIHTITQSELYLFRLGEPTIYHSAHTRSGKANHGIRFTYDHCVIPALLLSWKIRPQHI